METKVTTLTNNFAIKPKSAFTQLVEQLYAQKTTTIGNQGTLASVIGTCFASMSHVQNTWKRETFRDLLLHMEVQGCFALLRDEVYITAMANIAAFGNKLVREINTWEKDSFVAETQISSLIKHCFAKYEVPEFLESTFFAENKIHMLWYLKLGRGESVLSLSGFPVAFTKRMAHEFKNAPSNYTVSQAIRWAQAKGFGASAIMAETIAWSVLADHFEKEAFWKTVIVFFSKHDELSFSKVQEVLFYIGEQFDADKNFAIKGRTWDALVKQSDEWHAEYYKRIEALTRAEWATSGIRGFIKRTVEKEHNCFFYIVELTNSEVLYNEGYEMSHCVAEYEYDCIEGNSAIFSLRKEVDAEVTIIATIEVALHSKTVVQAKAKYNENISEEAYEMIIEWAEKEKLELDLEEYFEEENDFQALQDYIEAERPRNKIEEFDWKWVVYAAFLLIKACMLFSR